MSGLPPGFAPLDLDGPLDPDGYVARCPADATVKGMFAARLQELARDAGSPLGDTRRYIGFKDYPMRDFMALLVEGARKLYPQHPLRRGLFEVGRASYGTFLDSLTGRAVMGVMGKRPAALVDVTARAYELTQSHGRATVLEKGEGYALIRFTGLYQFLDSQEAGVVHEALRRCDFQADVRVRVDGEAGSGVMLAHWFR